MRKVFLTLTLSLCIGSLFAQKDTVRLREISRNQKAVVTDRPPQAVYFLIGGSGPLLSVNYDRRFSKRVNGLGFTAGLGYYAELGASIFSVPASLNYLIGRKSHFLELAAGTTFISATIPDFFDSENSSASGFIHHVSAGYRYQPIRGGFFFRGGFIELFSQGESATSAYLGFGYNY
jgi:hypothetical protein